MSLWFRQGYFHDSDYKTEFIHFLDDLHGLDLSLWDQSGFWDPDYVPFSFFEDGKMIANVCVYSLLMVVNGEACRVAQISSVGTIPSHRRRGLNRDLTERAREWCAEQGHQFVFLFADESAIPFYEACGFRHVPQHRYRIEPPAVTPVQDGRRAIDVTRSTDLERVAAAAADRTPASEVLGHRSAGLFMFHTLYTLRDCLFELPALDLIVAAREANGTLLLYDLIGPEIPTFADLQPHLQRDGITAYEFGFVPDKLEIEAATDVDDNGDGTHVGDGFPFEGLPFRFPYTAHA